MSERLRFAPSPSGGLHLGGARTALVNWLLARRAGGVFIVRIEDTAATGPVEGSEAAILEDLMWLGIQWDEGPDLGGPASPYRQSERTAIYDGAFATLQRAGLVYPCFCSPGELAAEREQSRSHGRPPRYSGRCRRLDDADRGRRLDAGEPAAWRFAVDPEGGLIAFDDIVHGHMEFSPRDIGDFVLRRSDGSPTFDLASVADDLDMRISTVVRGEDHLPNTPRHILLYRALGACPPRFGHLPLVVDSAGKPLSKSTGAPPIGSLRAEGIPASAVVHHLALLGWSDPTESQALGLTELTAIFDPARLSRSPAAHDPLRLRHLSAAHLRALPVQELAAALERHVPLMPGWIDSRALAEAVHDEIETLGDARTFVELLETGQPDAEAIAALGQPGASDALRAAAIAVRGASHDAEISVAVRDAVKQSGVRLSSGMPAVRAALLGRTHGPPVAVLVELLGTDRAASRLERATQERG